MAQDLWTLQREKQLAGSQAARTQCEYFLGGLPKFQDSQLRLSAVEPPREPKFLLREARPGVRLSRVVRLRGTTIYDAGRLGNVA